MKKRSFSLTRFATLTVAVLLTAFLAACDVGSSDDTSAVAVSDNGTVYDFSGNYENSGSDIVRDQKSGTKITYLRLTQYGKSLEGFDNASKTWKGHISTLTDAGVANFTLDGSTSDGVAIQIAGTLAHNSGNATMNASWIAPSYYSTVYAKATVANASSNNNNTTTVSISPGNVSVASEGKQVFSAKDGISPYSWSLSSSTYGNISDTTGNSTTFTALVVTGTTHEVTLTLRDGTGETAKATITVGTK